MSMMYISQLNNLVKHHLVLEYFERGIEGMCIKEFLPLCAALLFPYQNEKFPPENNLQGNILPIIESVKSYTKKTKGLENYSLDGLRKYFQYNWLPALDFSSQVRLIKGVSLIDKVEDNGFFSLTGNDKVYEAYLHRISVLDISNNYGEEAFEILEEEHHVDVTEEIEDNGEETGTDIIIAQDEPIKFQEKETSDTDGILVAEKKQRTQNICTDNSPFIQLYDELVAADPENRSKAKYTWQWLLSLDEYNAIKECVGTNKIPSPKKWDSKTARLLALYIGEFYKREYEKNINPFAQFGDDSPNVEFGDFKNVCSFLNIEPYKKVKDTHKFTICVSGGLPVHNIASKLDNDKSNSFIDGLSKLFDAEDGLDIVEGEELLEKINNTATALRESYHEHHSIYDYIQALLKDEKTWHDSDNENEEFREFKEKVKNAKKKAQERKKFKIFYSLWTFLDNSNIKEFNLSPQLRFNPEEDGERHYAISKQRLENWGIKNPPAQFSLKIGDTSLIFTICYNRDYISRGMVDRIDLPILDKNLKIEDLSNPDYTIIFDDLRDDPCPLKKDFYLPFKDGYMQLYTDDDPSMASWNSYKGAQAFRWSGILYDKNRYQLLSQNTIIDINEQIGWVTFADSVTFEDTSKGKIRTFFNSKGSIYAKPSNNSLHATIIDNPCLVEGCILDGQAECIIGDERGRAYIVKSNGITFDVFRAADNEKVFVSTVVKYKSACSYRDSSVTWDEYDSKKTLEQGLYVFRLSRDCYMTEVKCYVLPEKANISFINNGQYFIKFESFINVKSEGIRKTKKGDFIISDNRDNYTFSIGNDDGYITLRTYHPKPQIHLYLYGHEITDKPIIMAYAEDIEVNYISSQCSNKPKCRLSDYGKAYQALFNALKAPEAGEKGAKKRSCECKENEDNIKKKKDTGQAKAARITRQAQNASSLLQEGFDIKLDDSDSDSNHRIRVYTQKIPNDYNVSCKLMLLDLSPCPTASSSKTDGSTKCKTVCSRENKIKEFDATSDLIAVSYGSLLFQSLKAGNYTGVYYAPKFIPKNGKKLAMEERAKERLQRLNDYVEQTKFVTDYAYCQFEIACEHKMYFAVFDSLLCMCWDSKKQIYLDRNKKKFKDNILAFLKGYVAYTTKYSKEPFVIGLRRLAKEFLFDWTIIKKDIENSDSQQLKELYQEIINN